jgi:sialic acid synthase SpsE
MNDIKLFPLINDTKLHPFSFVIKTHNNTSRTIGDGYPVFTIAEIGSTHCGSLEIAKQLIYKAKEANVDCVKFQKRDIESLLTKKEKERKYDSVHSMAPTYGEHRQIMEFSEEQFIELRDIANKLDLFFTASGWDKKSVDFLDNINVPFFKVASADLKNYPLLEHIAKKKKPIFLSTGMASMLDIYNAYNIINQYENRIVLLQCTSSYPAPYSEINLNVLTSLQINFPNTILGYSGHEIGIVIPCVAIALGAKVIEKHFTLNNTFIGSDHKTALTPEELKELVTNIKNTELSLGSCTKEVQLSEESCIQKLCKSVTSYVNIKKGNIITENMITTKSPCTGIPASLFYDVIGKIAINDINADTTVTYDDILSK